VLAGGIAGLNMIERQPALRTEQMGVAFGHCDLHTLSRETSLYGNFLEEEYSNLFEAWRN
jgi:hypothetical protein